MASPIAEPGIAIRAWTSSVSFWPGTVPPFTAKPKIAAETTAARKRRASSAFGRPRRARTAPTGRDTPSSAHSRSTAATSYGMASHFAGHANIRPILRGGADGRGGLAPRVGGLVASGAVALRGADLIAFRNDSRRGREGPSGPATHPKEGRNATHHVVPAVACNGGRVHRAAACAGQRRIRP